MLTPIPSPPFIMSLLEIRFEVKKPGNIRLQIFDFGINLVRELRDFEAPTNGEYEAVWDGVDGKGRNVANGVYFYIIDTPDKTIHGKILLVE